MTIHWKAVEQYFIVALVVIQFYQVCNFGKFINFGLGLVEVFTFGDGLWVDTMSCACARCNAMEVSPCILVRMCISPALPPVRSETVKLCIILLLNTHLLSFVKGKIQTSFVEPMIKKTTREAAPMAINISSMDCSLQTCNSYKSFFYALKKRGQKAN